MSPRSAPVFARCSRIPSLAVLAAALVLVTPALATALTRPAPEQMVVEVIDPEVLALLEQRGFSFPDLIGAKGARTLDALARIEAPQGRAWRDIADVLSSDLEAFERGITGTRDEGHRFVIEKLAKNSKEAYEIEKNGDAPRQFDLRWFRSPFAFFRLVAVVNRADRRDFDADSPCGEVRFIYRLAYETPAPDAYRSSLPFFVNVVARPTTSDCRAFATSWRAPGGLAAADAMTRWLVEKGPLATPRTLKQLEVNFQSLRFSAGYMTDFGGQALYIMRIFRQRTDGLFSPIGLENTPDIDALARDPKLLSALLDYVTAPENVALLDEGRLVLPDLEGRLLTRRAISYSTAGRARLANKPFRDAFLAHAPHGKRLGNLSAEAKAALSRVDYAKLKFVKSPAGLVERLDNLSCMGCHQSGGTAGFHLLGLGDDATSDAYNQAEVGFSPHYAAERRRRSAYLDALADGRPPSRFRPHSFYPAASWPKDASALPAFEPVPFKGQCLEGGNHFGVPLACAADGRSACVSLIKSRFVDVEFGDCIVAPEHAPTALLAGSPCRTGTVAPRRPLRAPTTATGLPLSTFDFLDTLDGSALLYPALPEKVVSAGQSCRPTYIGVPSGRTFRRCDASEKRLDDVVPAMAGGPIPEQVCAAVGGSEFEKCATGNDVLGCLKASVTRGMVDSCSPSRACREDYICQRIPRELPGVDDRSRIDWLHERHVGFCTPTYFLFNMRADGHPDPITGKAEGLFPEQRSKTYRGAFGKPKPRP